MRLGKDYYTVNFPMNISWKVRKERVAVLKSTPLYKRMGARNTEEEANKIAAEIKAKYGYDMEVSETCDLSL